MTDSPSAQPTPSWDDAAHSPKSSHSPLPAVTLPVSQGEPVGGGASAASTQKKAKRKRLFIAGSIITVFILLIAAFTVPVNAVIESPGPTWNVLGKADDSSDSGADVITVTGTQTYATSGALRMTTVAVRGCPGYPVTFADLVRAWASSTQTVVDRETVCPSSMSAEEVDSVNKAQMSSSESSAVVAALLETGKASRTILTVAGVSNEQKNADLREGDVLVSITPKGGQATEISGYSQLREILAGLAPGSEVTLGITRGGTPQDVSITTIAPGDQDGDGQKDSEGSLLGVYLTVEADSPIKASFGLQDVGGPSAGMMFALGIIDDITPGEMTGGKDIAGTGTISVDGTVGAIGGIAQKMAGARSDGAQYFLAPSSNCNEVIGHIPSGLQVFAVSTLHEAVTATEAIASGDTSSLTTCDSLLSH